MQVLQFYKTSLPESVGGIEQTIHQIAQGCSRRGITTEVLSLTSGSAPASKDMGAYTVHQVPESFHIASTGFSLSAFGRFSELAKKADIIHYHFPWPFMDLVHFATNVKKPSVLTYHSDIIRQKLLFCIYRPLMRRFLNNMDCIIATSPNYVATSKTLISLKRNIFVIPIGLDKSTYPCTRPKRVRYWKSVFTSKFFLFIGAMRYYKGLHILLEAAQEVDFPIVIVGAGPTENELKTRASKLGLQNIRFLGHLPDEDKVALLMQCYAVLFPSHLRSEAFGISLLEGAMYGKPMISCEIGTGTSFINVENETGLIVPPSDAAALRQAMTFLWNHPDDAANMGRNAEERYWKYFTEKPMLDAYIKIYHQLTSQ